jgi:hypothetical protein
MADKRINNGGPGRNQGRKKIIYINQDNPKNTTVRVKPSIVATCREKHGSLTKALEYAAKII